MSPVRARTLRPMENFYYEKLVNIGIRFVSYRPRSEKEFRDFLGKKLVKWKVSGSVLLDRVIGRLTEIGYVDDQKFTEWWVGQRTAFRPKGKRLIQMELAKKGVPRSIIASAVTAEDSGSLEEAAAALVAKKMAVWAKLPTIEAKMKVYGYLGRRGFDGETIARVIDAWGKKGYNKA